MQNASVLLNVVPFTKKRYIRVEWKCASFLFCLLCVCVFISVCICVGAFFFYSCLSIMLCDGKESILYFEIDIFLLKTLADNIASRESEGLLSTVIIDEKITYLSKCPKQLRQFPITRARAHTRTHTHRIKYVYTQIFTSTYVHTHQMSYEKCTNMHS